MTAQANKKVADDYNALVAGVGGDYPRVQTQIDLAAANGFYYWDYDTGGLLSPEIITKLTSSPNLYTVQTVNGTSRVVWDLTKAPAVQQPTK